MPTGEDLLDGRRALKYNVVSPRGEKATVWIDCERRFLLRLNEQDGHFFVLRPTDKKALTADAFEVPPHYGKFDPAQLIELIKKSDVWVDAPK